MRSSVCIANSISDLYFLQSTLDRPVHKGVVLAVCSLISHVYAGEDRLWSPEKEISG